MASKTSVYYRVVKAGKSHPFSGLYAIEKIYIQGGSIEKKEIVKEWDLRILTEAALGRFGGVAAYDEYVADNGEPKDRTSIKSDVVAPRTPEELGLTKKKLAAELKGQVD